MEEAVATDFDAGIQGSDMSSVSTGVHAADGGGARTLRVTGDRMGTCVGPPSRWLAANSNICTPCTWSAAESVASVSGVFVWSRHTSPSCAGESLGDRRAQKSGVAMEAFFSAYDSVVSAYRARGVNCPKIEMANESTSFFHRRKCNERK